MSKNIRKNTNTGNNEPEGGAPKPQRKTVAAKAKPKAVSTENKSKRKSSPEIKDPASEINHSAPDSYRDDIPPSEITKSEIENPKSEIPMEVHHHPQLEHKPKPLKEYLLEGFMIFIAVMMGFIAENVREYIDNNEHVQQLCAQLVRDLKADTAELNNVSIHTAIIARQNDTLFNILQQPLASADAKKMLLLADDSHSMWPFHPTGGAIEAIKNELHLKQFSNSAIISFIAHYEGHSQLMHTAQDITLQYQRLYIDPFMLQHFNPHDVDDALNRRPIRNVQAHNLNQANMMQMAGEMALVHVNTNEQLRDCGWLKKDATELLQYVQKHFDIQ